jgi:hypothetical protein
MEIAVFGLRNPFKKAEQPEPLSDYEAPLLTESERENLGEPKAHIRLIDGEKSNLVEIQGKGTVISNMLVLALEAEPALFKQFKQAMERVKMRRTTMGRMLDEVMMSGDCTCEDCTAKREQTKE